MTETASFGDWLKTLDDPVRTERIRQFGLLTGLRAEADGTFRPANWERGLVLDRIVETRRPQRILEIGTGRGLGAFSMAAAGRAYGVDVSITTADLLPLSQAQDYAIEIAGERKRLQASCAEIWKAHLDPALTSRIQPLTGRTTATLPQLAREGRTFDFVFIDAGHDLFSVAHDLAYAARLLTPEGAILMDDFAPLEEFGLGTCVALTHARRLFAHLELFASEGLTYGGAVQPESPRGMIFLTKRRGEIRINRALFSLWRLAGFFLQRCYEPRFFPAQLR